MMAISLIEVDTGRLTRDIRSLRMTLNQTRAHLTSLREKMNAMNSMWDGPTNLALRQRFAADHERMQELCATVDELIQLLETIRQSYDTCENNVRGAVDTLRV